MFMTRQHFGNLVAVFWFSFVHDHTSHTKYDSKLHGVSFHFNPFPSLFHSSRQFSPSPLSYLKLFGSPEFQFSKVSGLPVDIQKNFPSSAMSVPLLQKCSFPIPKLVICSSKFFCSMSELILARCIPWNLQYCSALNQLALKKIPK